MLSLKPHCPKHSFTKLKFFFCRSRSVLCYYQKDKSSDNTHFQNKMETIEALASRCRVATPSDTVLHSECAFTFHSPFTTDSGIVVNLNSFIGTIQELAFSNVPEEKDIFVRIVKKRVEKEISEGEAPTKLAIGVEGGFATDDDKFDTVSTYSVVVLEKSGKEVAEISYDDATKEKFPEAVVKSVESVIHHVGLAIQQDLTAWQDDEEIPVSKYTEGLPFIENGVTISPDPKSWKCEKSGDTENLWLNLSDGFIGGGRKNVSREFVPAGDSFLFDIAKQKQTDILVFSGTVVVDPMVL